MKTRKKKPRQKKKTPVYVDMDGVLTDFCGDALQCCSDAGLHSHVVQLAAHGWPADEYSLAGALGIGEYTLADCINRVPTFWSRLTALPSLTWLLKEYLWVRTDIELYILSSPGSYPDSATGKLFWVKASIGDAVPVLLVPSNCKKLLAKPGSILIDDSDTNVEDWQAAGGTGVLFPQLWNTKRLIALAEPQAVKDSVIGALNEILGPPPDGCYRLRS